MDESFTPLYEDFSGIKFERVIVSGDMARSTLEELIPYMNAPLENPVHIGTYLLSKRAKQLGIDSILTGDGSDEFNLGYGCHRLPPNKYVGARCCLPDELIERLYTDGAKAKMVFVEGYDGRNIDTTNTIEEVLSCDRQERLVEYHLRRLDSMTMAHSLEARVPFLDKRFVEFISFLPHSFLQGDGGKEFLKKISEAYLPESLIYRKKVPFPSLVDEWTSGKGLEWVIKHLLKDNSKIREWIKIDELDILITEHKQGQETHGRALWGLVTLELWLQHHDKLI